MTALRSGSATDVGRVRSVNQDRVLDAYPLFAVADGMGGHAGGEVASRMAIEAFSEAFDGDPTATGLTAAARRANLAVWERSRSDAGLRGMGTTLTAAALVADEGGAEGDERLAVVNVGDSRAYLLRASRLTQLTDDHSLVEEMVRSGELTAEQAAVHPQRHIVTRALGIEPEVEVDALALHPVAGDRLLLCSDGLVNEIGDAEIGEVLTQLEDPQAASDELVARARAHGGGDNITVVVVDVVAAGAAETAAAPASGAEEPSGGALSGKGTSAMATAAHPIARPTDQRGEQEARAEEEPLPTEAGPRARRPRVLTARAVVFSLLVLLVIGGAVAAVGWFATRSYYVGLSGHQVVIYQGRPGGFLWFQPRVASRSALTTSDVLPSRLLDLRQGTEEPSLAAAHRYVANLAQEASGLPGTSPGTTSAPPPAPPLGTTTTLTRVP